MGGKRQICTHPPLAQHRGNPFIFSSLLLLRWSNPPPPPIPIVAAYVKVRIGVGALCSSSILPRSSLFSRGIVRNNRHLKNPPPDEIESRNRHSRRLAGPGGGRENKAVCHAELSAKKCSLPSHCLFSRCEMHLPFFLLLFSSGGSGGIKQGIKKAPLSEADRKGREAEFFPFCAHDCPSANPSPHVCKSVSSEKKKKSNYLPPKKALLCNRQM